MTQLMVVLLLVEVVAIIFRPEQLRLPPEPYPTMSWLLPALEPPPPVLSPPPWLRPVLPAELLLLTTAVKIKESTAIYIFNCSA